MKDSKQYLKQLKAMLKSNKRGDIFQTDFCDKISNQYWYSIERVVLQTLDERRI